MKEEKINIIDKFLYKFFIGMFLLLGIVLLDYFEVVEYEKVKSSFSSHYNVLEMVKKVNGSFEIIPIDLDDEISVSGNSYLYTEKLDDCRKILQGDYEAVENYALGIVVEVERNKDKTYRVVVKGIDDIEYVYDKLEQVDCKIYKYVKSGDIIGKASFIDDNNYFIFQTFKDGKYYDILGRYED